MDVADTPLEREPDVHIHVLAPTFLEYAMTRVRLPDAEWAGMRLRRWRGRAGAVILCGLAGALSGEPAPGSVVVPTRVGLPDGSLRECDADLRAALLGAAADRHFPIVEGDLLTADHLIVGTERGRWRARGFVAADMETGLVPETVRFATVRVILDAPEREIAPAWEQPLSALLTPALWRQSIRLLVDAPRFALRAADVAREALARVEVA